MEEVVAAATPPPPKEKEELDQVVDDKREEGVPESDVTKEVGVKVEGASYTETRRGSGLFLCREGKCTHRKKGKGKEDPQVYGAIMLDNVMTYFGIGDTIIVHQVFLFFFFFPHMSLPTERCRGGTVCFSCVLAIQRTCL
jgi:hypothetical protein